MQTPPRASGDTADGCLRILPPLHLKDRLRAVRADDVRLRGNPGLAEARTGSKTVHPQGRTPDLGEYSLGIDHAPGGQVAW